jgi:serine protease Do
MSKRIFLTTLLLSSTFGGLVASAAFLLFGSHYLPQSIERRQQVVFSPAHYNDTSYQVPPELNFTQAAEEVRKAVVHIKTSQEGELTRSGEDENLGGLLRDFHGFPFRGPRRRESAGSGVIISADGYIATNHHVIEEAQHIDVVLNDKRSYKATLIGIDPSTDLALLKIEEKSLPFVRYGNSDKLRIGEWVMAVGNPFDLTSTVTAGIVSAKGRNINIISDIENYNLQVESFIQTDAAVNPGNSGGALVNVRGELVGINTAIATNTGFYAGYSFAIPIRLVRKVMDDLLRFGNVQRALLGVSIREVDADLAQEKGLDNVRGVYVNEVNENSSAQVSGLKAGDVILSIDNLSINSTSELQEVVASYHPGDKVVVVFERNHHQGQALVLLRNKAGTTAVATKEEIKPASLFGAELIPTTEKENRKLGIDAGVKIAHLEAGKLKETLVEEGFVITHLDHKAVTSPEEVVRIIRQSKSAILIEGFDAKGKKEYKAIAP